MDPPADAAAVERAATTCVVGDVGGVYARPTKRRGRPHLLLIAPLVAACVVACATPASPSTEVTRDPTVSSSPGVSASPSPPDSIEPTPAPTAAPLAWQQREATGPRAREDHTWTANSDGTAAYLFGGRDGSMVMGDLWTYDLAADAWSAIEAPAAPPPRFGHEAVWVDGIGLVIFAGQSGPNFFNDLWAFDPETTTWRELPAGGDVPVARYGTCAGIGPDGRLRISHGFTSDGTRFADTKAYDFGTATWTDETPGGDLPVSRCLHGCWWTADGTFALFGGQTTGVTALDDHWLLNDDGWQRVDGAAPPARNLYARARLDGATLVFGGQGLDGGRLGDAWLFRDGGADAMALPVDGGGPPGRSGAEMVVDGTGGRVLLFGGLGEAGVLADVWQLTGDPLAGR